jgi:choline-sulfatase
MVAPDEPKAAQMTWNHELTRRDALKAAAAASMLAGAVAVGAGPADAEAAEQPFRPRGRLRRRPNFLVVIVDEQRTPPVYETQALQQWRRNNLHAQNLLRANGMDFTHHHVMATACAPSRASFLTGQYPSLHGVTQTSGMAKGSMEPDLFWLDPRTVPTMGSWFRAAGYDTYYKGKWHVSEADLFQPGTTNPLPSFTEQLERSPELERAYLDANRLAPYGFDGWIGPEPHGSNPYNSASSGAEGKGRDRLYAQQGVDLLKQLRTSPRPWLAVTSFVNPHDIVLWGVLSLLSGNLYLAQQLIGSDVPQELFIDRLFGPSRLDELSDKPRAQQSYKDTYPEALQPIVNGVEYHRFYYELQRRVDGEIHKVLTQLASATSMYRDTVVLYFSDHGDLLGSHNAMFQKWHVAYDEVVRVPLVVHNPQLFPAARSTSMLTSHADVLPTMLGLAGLDEGALRSALSTTHTQVRPLPGRDLSGVLLGDVPEQQIPQTPLYFMTDDEPTRGREQVSWNGRPYQAVVQPNHLEAVITMLPTGSGGALERWKYVRYFDNPAFWSSPGTRDAQTLIDGNLNVAGEKEALTTVKTSPEPDEFEVYNVSADPTEVHNLAESGAHAAIVSQLRDLLDEQRAAKRLTPTTQPYMAGASSGGRFRYPDPDAAS